MKYKIGQFLRVVDNKTNNFVIGQIVEIVDVYESNLLCKGYCCDRRYIDEQFVSYHQVEAIPGDGQ